MTLELVQTWTRDGLRLDGAFQSPRSAVTPAGGIDGFCLVHGTGGNFYGSTLFEGLSQVLLDLGCAVLRINTRGHDGISTAALARGGKRLGAAYELVDDCRHDLVAWADWLRQRCGPRIGLIGHSLGAVKCLYAVAHEPPIDARCIAALSPPRLSYSWFCSSPEGPQFLKIFTEADQWMQKGQPGALLEVALPLSYVITAAGFVEKYGPDERYNYLRYLPGVTCPVLVTLGELEVRSNMAFRGTAEALAEVRQRCALAVATIAGADHFYSGVREALFEEIKMWLRSQAAGDRE